MKYIFTGKTKLHNGRTLKQIKRVSDDLIGGWIESEANLSQDDTCFVFDNAEVLDNAEVFGDAEVYGNAEVFGDAKVYGNAKVFGDAKVYGNAKVFGKAKGVWR